jgi:hypothetical protein
LCDDDDEEEDGDEEAGACEEFSHGRLKKREARAF